ncbi:hypothetical protein [Peribacillus frigoritolerans]|uniref:hypothetical protein n=1 Tax=Peribacillus frigoritolerans TaxID=450367 RepID=UPI001F504158|nr:hypothetical protein [Peribacillus frigoritolerans]MCK2018839.1 hypothetical protein [Peribacillus frigoritolerans]
MENENKPPQNGSWIPGCMAVIFIVGVLGTIAYFIISAVIDVVGNDDDEDYYEYDSDDKDSDGDVDYDDAEKYLDDSLKEDVNDGDDW